ncbi:MAG: hypothetical protein HYY84_03635 [Deltaproteobacteria bacterium]|nr:hypothetical protein [Deltaproteobacteria bacterium]
MCEGAVELAAAANSATGVCAAPDAGFAACAADSECAAREACRCGRCVLPLCSEQADCPPGHTCNKGRCDLTNGVGFDCPSGTALSSGLCVPTCASPADCRVGEACVGGLCDVRTCLSGTGCSAGESCHEARRAVSLGSPVALVVDGGVRIWFEARGSSASSIRSATSADGLKFTSSSNAALTATNAWEGTRVAAPSVIAADGGFLLFYEGGLNAAGIGVSWSTSGDTFVSQSTSAPLIAASAAWESGRIGGPSVVAWDGPTTIYYEAGPANARAIGVATTNNAGSFDRAGPILTATSVSSAAARGPGWSSVLEVYAPSAMRLGSAAAPGATWLWFSVRGIEKGAAIINESIGFAVAPDGVSAVATPYNPAYHRFNSYLTAMDEGEPSLIPVGENGLRLYFTSRGPNDGLGVARSFVE